MLQLRSYLTPVYENIEFTLNDGQTDYDLDVNQAAFLSKFQAAGMPIVPSFVMIRTNQTITVKLNKTTNDAITITSTDSPFVIDGVLINNMFLSNASGSNAAVKLFFREAHA